MLKAGRSTAYAHSYRALLANINRIGLEISNQKINTKVQKVEMSSTAKPNGDSRFGDGLHL